MATTNTLATTPMATTTTIKQIPKQPLVGYSTSSSVSPSRPLSLQRSQPHQTGSIPVIHHHHTHIHPHPHPRVTHHSRFSSVSNGGSIRGGELFESGVYRGSGEETGDTPSSCLSEEKEKEKEKEKPPSQTQTILTNENEKGNEKE